MDIYYPIASRGPMPMLVYVHGGGWYSGDKTTGIGQGDLTLSTAIINACKPYHWIKEFPPSVKTSPELAHKTKQKWSEVFRSL